MSKRILTITYKNGQRYRYKGFTDQELSKIADRLDLTVISTLEYETT